MNPPLRGRVALVDGATRGAGRGIAVELSRAGAVVCATGRSRKASGPSDMARPGTIEDGLTNRRTYSHRKYRTATNTKTTVYPTMVTMVVYGGVALKTEYRRARTAAPAGE
jgi:NAD(P)-dependent dehydrogenase (short-subunit alcohol dehydrogenase family)